MNPEIYMATAILLEPLAADLASLGNTLLLILPPALLLICVGSRWIAKRALRPVEHLTAAAGRITAGSLDERVSGRDTDREFARLIDVFNGMLDRLERSFHQAQRFSADAAHELKTPLAIIQGQLENALQSESVDPGHRETMTSLLDETVRLKSITQKLLLLARADAGRLEPSREKVDITGLLNVIADDFADMDTGLKIIRKIDVGLTAAGDGNLLRQAVQNLLHNAVKYNETDGTIWVTTAKEGAGIVLRIANTGPEIPESQRSLIFHRFHRGDESRSRDSGGFGLGLSIAREIARIHGGELTLESSTPAGTCFRLELPGLKTV